MQKRNVTVDWSAVERMLPILPYVERREPIPVELVDELVASPGIRMWLEHATIHGGFDEQKYRALLKQAETAEVPTGNRWLDILLKSAGRADEIRRLLAAILDQDFEQLCDRAFENANQYLTEPFNGPVKTYLLAATRGSAIVLDYAMAVDIADFEDPQVKPIDMDSLFSSLTHEIFHMGRQASFERRGIVKPEGLMELAYELTGRLFEEGLATYFTSEEFIKKDPVSGPGYMQTLERLPEVANWLQEAFAMVESGNWDEQKMQPGLSMFIMNGMYALGTEMCKAIERVLGREALVECMQDTAIFCSKYNQAVDAGNLDMPRMPENVVRLSAQLWAKP